MGFTHNNEEKMKVPRTVEDLVYSLLSLPLLLLLLLDRGCAPCDDDGDDPAAALMLMDVRLELSRGIPSRAFFRTKSTGPDPQP
jgi:hypothetical protein